MSSLVKQINTIYVTFLIIFLYCGIVTPSSNNEEDNKFRPYYFYLQTGKFNNIDYNKSSRNVFLKFIPSATANGPGFEFAYLYQSTKSYKDIAILINPSFQAGNNFVKFSANIGIFKILEGDSPKELFLPSVGIKIGNMKRVFLSVNAIDPVYFTTRCFKIHIHFPDNFSEISIGKSKDWENEENFYHGQLFLRLFNDLLFSVDYFRDTKNDLSSFRVGLGYAFNFIE